MPALSRMLVAALSLVMAGTLVVTVDGAAVASTRQRSAATTASADEPAASAGLGLGGDVVWPRGGRKAAAVKKWRVRYLRYHETLPTKWDWSLRTAVSKWNAAGARIRLVRVATARKAQVRVTYGAIGGAAGLATIGARKNAFVRLNSRYATADGTSARNRLTVMNVLAHELGHVLGFRHTTGRCTLMAPVLDITACEVLPAEHPGYYKCATLDRTLVQRFVRLYGGRARYPASATCLIDPLPPVLSGVSFAGGTSGPVTIRWKPPASLPAGSGMVVRRWESSSCSTYVPPWAETFRPAPRAGVWQDGAANRDETACFTLRVVNRYGAGRAPLSKVLERWVPPIPAPTIGAASYDEDADQFTFPVTLEDGLLLQARWNAADPGACLTGPIGATNVAHVPVSDGTGTLAAPATLPQCVSFFAHDPETNRFSPATPVTFEAPLSSVPAAPAVEEPTWDAARPAFLAPATYPEGTDLVYDMLEDPQACPGDYTRGQPVTEDEETIGEGVVSFLTVFPDQCVSFYAVDDETGLASEPTQVTVHAPLPTETPTMGPITVLDNAYPWFEAELGGAAPGNKVGYAVLAGSCPATPPAVSRWRTQLQGDGNPPSSHHASYGLFPSVAAGTNCVVLTSLDWFGWLGPRDGSWLTERHGPVVMREFVDEGPEPPSIGEPVWQAGQGTFHVPVAQRPSPTLHAIYDPDDPTTCPVPGAPGTQQLNLVASWLDGEGVQVTPPATPYSCVTFYVEASEGPVPLSQGVPIDLDVPQG